MSDTVVSLIRTYVPLAVGYVLTRLAELGVVDVDGEALIGAVTAIVAGLYYAAARFAEKRWPAAGWLLGARAQPSYEA